MTHLVEIRLEDTADHASIDSLVLNVFGPGVVTRAAFRVRESAPHQPELSFVASHNNRLIGSVRLTPIAVGDNLDGHLLGPLVVDQDFKNCGYGRALVRKAVGEAQVVGSGFVMLVGDAPYYGPLGFSALNNVAVQFPGPVDRDRLLIAEFQEGVSASLTGMVKGLQVA